MTRHAKESNTMDKLHDSAPTVDMRRQLGDNEPASPAKETT